MIKITGHILGSILTVPEPKTDLERQLLAENALLRERIAALEKQVEELSVLLAKALKNSSTSSKPPSSDIVKPPKKTPATTPDGKCKKGGQPGHPRVLRQPFSPDEVATIKRYVLEVCPDCGGTVSLVTDKVERVIQQAEVMPAPICIEEHRGGAYQCSGCGKIHYVPMPATVERGGLIGPVLTAQIAYMKGALHASFSTIRKYVRDVMGLTLSRGHLSNIVQKVSDALEGPYNELLLLLRSEDIVNIDETGHKDNGARFWTWCFRATRYTAFKVSDTRSSKVLFDVLDEDFSGTLGCDFFSAYHKYMRICDARVQFCLAHFIREIKFLTTLPDPATVNYGKRLLGKMRDLFGVIHQHDALSDALFAHMLSEARNAILNEAQQEVPEAKHAQLVAKRLRDHGEAYFRFITTPGLEPTNNLAEQAIRFVAIDRHITQGTRGEKGCQWSERIWTVMAPCTLQGRSAFEYLVAVVHAYFNGLPPPSLVFNTS
jgi:transposase